MSYREIPTRGATRTTVSETWLLVLDQPQLESGAPASAEGSNDDAKPTRDAARVPPLQPTE